MKIVKSFPVAVLMLSIASVAPAFAKAKPGLIGKPHAVSFGKVKIGKTSHTKTVKLFNAAGAAMAISPSASAPFTVSGNTCGAELAPRKRCTIALTFSPASAADPKGSIETGALVISDGAGTALDSVKLVGVAFGASPDPSPSATPTPISATEAGSAAVLKGIGGAGITVLNGDKLYLGLLALDVVQTPRLLPAFIGSGGPAGNSIDDIRSWLADEIVRFETSGLYGDTNDELPRATCDFTANPSGDCVANPNALVITYKDYFGQTHTTTFDWTGAGTGTASPTVQGHDPLNPDVSFELPTRMAFSFSTGGNTIISFVTDSTWHPSPCMPGEVLFDIGNGGDASATILGLDGLTKIIDVPNASAEPSDGALALSFSAGASGGGALVSASATVPVTGTIDRSGTCGAFEGATVTSVGVNASASDGSGDSGQIGFTADNFTAPSNGQSPSADLSNGEFLSDGNFGTFAGTLNDTNGDGIWGDDVTIQFADGAVSLEQFLIDEFGATPH